MEIWLFRQRLSLSAGYFPQWEKPLYAIWNNGGRQSNEVLDVGVNFWRFGLHFTLWHIGAWSKLLRLFAKQREADS